MECNRKNCKFYKEPSHCACNYVSRNRIIAFNPSIRYLVCDWYRPIEKEELIHEYVD